MASSTYMGFDLSTQQLKAIVVDSGLKLLQEAKVDFDADFPHYGTSKGVLTNDAEHEIFAPVAMWLEALNLVLDRLKSLGVDFTSIKAISGAGMQHGVVFWTKEAEDIMRTLDASETLVKQLLLVKDSSEGTFSHEFSPNWQDASTQAQCDQFNAVLGGPEKLAEVTGSSAHHRFSGPQIMSFREKYPEKYANTARISLVSSWLASILLGKVAPIDRSDVGGMNLQDLQSGTWNQDLLTLVAGSKEGAADLHKKLGDVPTDGGASFGNISPYFTTRYGFPETCQIIPFTGDNPSTIIALPMRENEAIVSLGTSTTFLMSTSHYKPHPSYHFMPHPTTPGLYMFMLCYKNGGLAREQIRDTLNLNRNFLQPTTSTSWTTFNDLALSTPPLGQSTPSDPMRLGLYFPRPEIVPAVHAGLWRTHYSPLQNTLTTAPQGNPDNWTLPDNDARAILESQFLSIRLRSAPLVTTPSSHPDLPPQPSRIYLVGGGALNHAITNICGQVLGSAEGVYRLDVGSNACALGAAYKAVWGAGRRDGETFEAFVGARWREDGFVQRVADGYEEGVWERYGQAVGGLEMLEQEVVRLAGVGGQ
ncbi:D-xylulose kinase [Microthyrium microscopicum]|uniref:Xylulose kinase n=1 Tax=Microthyrium microscopicum TaxID=703497 RepID=A0A6A6U148_9PEZI|nr:D-xylulose kinase [Microthyrium microscopicum]